MNIQPRDVELPPCASVLKSQFCPKCPYAAVDPGGFASLAASNIYNIYIYLYIDQDMDWKKNWS